MDNIKEKVKKILNQILNELNNGLSIYDVNFKSGGTESVLQVMLQGDHFINMDEIVEVNDLLSDQLDKIANEMPNSYVLDVSSAGLEREIRNDDELSQAIGKDIKISCYRKYKNSKVYLGTLLGFDDNQIRLNRLDKKEVVIPREYISKLNYALIM